MQWHSCNVTIIETNMRIPGAMSQLNSWNAKNPEVWLNSSWNVPGYQLFCEALCWALCHLSSQYWPVMSHNTNVPQIQNILQDIVYVVEKMSWFWSFKHDDVIKWIYIFRIPGHLCGNSPVTGEFPAQRPVNRSFDVFCAWISGWVNNGEADDLRCHHAHYDISVMEGCDLSLFVALIILLSLYLKYLIYHQTHLVYWNSLQVSWWSSKYIKFKFFQSWSTVKHVKFHWNSWCTSLFAIFCSNMNFILMLGSRIIHEIVTNATLPLCT